MQQPTNQKTEQQSQFNKTEREDRTTQIDHPVRRVLIFQIKLAFDAMRDILLSPISIGAALIDWVQGRDKQHSLFEMLMQIGRKSDQKINLFEHYQGDERTIDSVLSQVEEVLVKEYKKGQISEKTKAAIEKKLKISR